MLFFKFFKWFLSVFVVVVCFVLLRWMTAVKPTRSDPLPTLYEYYAPKNAPIKSGLTIVGDQFRLNDKPFVIYSGTFHYFRVLPERWRLTLKKLKAAGLNTVQFYIPWNSHEPQPGQFDFESYGLNLTQFLVDIREADMFAIVRPGPYICAEWDLGGLPSWLLKDPNMELRSEYPGFMEPAKKYYSKVLDLVERFQFSKHGGPIIAMQIENEYYSDTDIDHKLSYMDGYLKFVISKNFTDFLFVSENFLGASLITDKKLNLFEAINLNVEARDNLAMYRAANLIHAIYLAEFWTGWFDQWGEPYHQRAPLERFDGQVSEILFNNNGSINLYPFIGGTNFGFFASYHVVTSYDYDAPLTEFGNYTDKYWKTREFYEKMVALGRHPKIKMPSEPPKIDPAQNYGTVSVNSYFPFKNFPKFLRPIQSDQPLFMESIAGFSGFGFIMYRFQSKPFETLNITGRVADRMSLMVDGEMVNQTEDFLESFYQTMDESWFPDPEAEYIIDLLVENLGRLDYGFSEMQKQRKGINSSILLDGKEQQEFQIFTFDLNETFLQQVNRSDQWKTLEPDPNNTGPILLRTYLVIKDETPSDTFVLLPEWTHGNVFINNFNIGRYNRAGPQKTLYIPGPLLRQGTNTIHIFETGTLGSELKFIDQHLLE